MGAFEHLLDTAKKYEGDVKALPDQADKQTLWTGIGFGLLEERFVASMGEVVEVMPAPQSTRLPGVKKFVSGISNVRGRLMTLIDLSLFFGERPKVAKSSRRVLVLDDEAGYFGFLVDESMGMQHFPQDGFSRQVGQIEDRIKPFLLGSYRTAGALWPVMSLHAILADPKLEKLAG